MPGANVAKYKTNSNKSSAIALDKRSLLTIGLVIGIVVLGWYGGKALGWWGAADEVIPEPVAETPTTYDIVIHDYLSTENDDEMEDHVTLAWLEYDYSEIDDEDVDDTLADLVYADFTADGADDTKTPDADSVYLLSITGTDSVSLWYATDSRIFAGLLPLLVLGTNDIYIMNATEDVSILCYDSVSLTSTINQTDYRDWTIAMNCLDAAEGTTAEIDEDQGYLPYYDPSTAEDMSPVLEIQFNTTASAAWCELQSGYENREVASGNYLYIEIDMVLFDSQSIEIRFSSLLGSSFEVIGMVLSYGYASSNTDWDSQN